uniref:NADH dehydrogenase subunit 4L n=1 Tax=Lissachatina fulica TaxID=2315439 RepID=A0A097J9I9_LISFU|nr:NADH dehydrogenase subunit 4L [Lissachatina fulica]AIE43755.1 NADH dehydrogenase subunit 4L [Lissachatina fulica]AIT76123.1 NADH dehydrogenase subunit 4L [Lissachatina fulica]ARM20332.1 NADH dehydrogenase subunit 4L [Lissachatina fulica]WJZ52995.1 NADH dehydrogenase subunit 4L [Lissachatina fulica]
MKLEIYFFVLMMGFTFAFCFSVNRIIVMLMLIEGMMLSSMCLTLYLGVKGLLAIEFFMVLATFSVIEAALGLTLLVSAIRISASDLIKSSWS